MKPDKDKNSLQKRHVDLTPINDSPVGFSKSQEAAAKIIRSQIDRLFDEADKSSGKDQPGQPSNNEVTNPYERTHSDTNADSLTRTNNWQEYHSAWQDYYKQYYESYYRYVYDGQSNQPSDEDIAFGLRQKIIKQVHSSAEKAKSSRHFKPILLGLIAAFVLLFMQYNQLLIGKIHAYISPGSIDQQNIIIDPSDSLSVGVTNTLIIPKINVNVPVMYDIGNDYNSQMSAMAQGVAHFAIPGANAHPGEIGNTVLAGHSSNDWLDSGDYKFIFAQLEKLEDGDVIYLNYQSVRYTYVVTGREIVEPSDVQSLVYNTNEPILTLVTCTPVGTDRYRLLLSAKQINPDYGVASTGQSNPVDTVETIPGDGKTFLEKLLTGDLW